ncbi:MAG: hypothetical protein ACLQMH_05145 [Solirubrobacteraceae bacterium]
MTGPRPDRHDRELNHRPRVKSAPLLRVLWLENPRRSLGRHGPIVVGVMSDAPLALRAAWGVAGDGAPDRVGALR